MGTHLGHFVGHSIPGLFFVLLGAWWMIRALRHYFWCLTTRVKRFRSWLTWSPACCCSIGLDLEALICVLMCVIGICVELLHGIKPNNIQHATMYIFFGLPCLLGILLPRLRRALPEPEKLVYLFMALAFIVEGILFNYHLEGRKDDDVLVHVLLVYVVFACAACCIWEMNSRESILAVLGRAYFTLLQGMWFFQTAFYLYNPFNDVEEDEAAQEAEKPPGHAHMRLMIISSMFTWHLGAAAVFLVVTSVIVSRCYPGDPSHRDMGMLNGKSRECEETYSLLEENEDESDRSSQSPPLLAA